MYYNKKIIKQKMGVNVKKIFVLLVLLFAITGCSKTVEFETVQKSNTGFHKINEAEKIDGGVIYYSGDNILFDKDGFTTELANKVRDLWREDDEIYYDSNNVLYSFNFKTKETKKMVEKPYNILGKYNGNIISYYGRTIYSINGTKKIKLFKGGYYLNKAVLYKNKVYGVPATNVYEYNLDTLKVKKITKDSEMSYFDVGDKKLYIITKKKRNYVYYKLTDSGLKKDFVIENVMGVTEKTVKNGMFIETNKDYNEYTKGNQLLYVYDGKIKKVDSDYRYYMIGIVNNKFCYYKNEYNYGTYDKNLETFYLYDGKKKTKAFDLNVDNFEAIIGYEYDDGLLIEVVYESFTTLYKYDGKRIIKLDTPDNFYSIIGLEIVDNKAYIRYSDGEESFTSLGTIITLS